MRNGRAEEVGGLSELLEANGTFSSMWEKQQGFTVGRDGRSASVTAARLGAVPLFSGLSDAHLERLSREFVAQQFGQDIVVFENGDPGDRFHVIVRGVVEVCVDGSEGGVVIAHLEDGDFFGEMALLDDAPRNATVTAVIPTTTLSLDRDQFGLLMADAPEMARAVREASEARARMDQAL